jgi:hypothetical protein
MVNSEEITGTTEHLTLYMRRRINCRCNGVRLYLFSSKLPTQFKFLLVFFHKVRNICMDSGTA